MRAERDRSFAMGNSTPACTLPVRTPTSAKPCNGCKKRTPSAVSSTRISATLIAVYGLFTTPPGWNPTLFVRGYAPAWFLVSDRVKLLAVRKLEAMAAPERGQAKAGPASA
jgi:hypothetical protein